jgi:predicted nucleic acid-binding protein
MVKALFDTNILIDYLQGVPDAREELARFEDAAISIVTWMEVMVGATDDTHAATRAFLTGFRLIALDRAVALRRRHRMKLPDAIIWAAAQSEDRILVTRNTRDFPAEDPGVRVPYGERSG